MDKLLWLILIISLRRIVGEQINEDPNRVFQIIETPKNDNLNHHIRSLPEPNPSSNSNNLNNNLSVDKNWSSLSEILDVYSTKNLAKNWDKIDKYTISSSCYKETSRYIDGLKNQEMWALKADDASGRFTNGFFWGNSYFLGSATECVYIGYDYTKKNYKLLSSNTSISSKKINAGISGSYLVPTIVPDNPPFQLGFFMMTISINNTILSSNTRVIQLGVCLPFSCTAKDIFTIGKLAASETASKFSTIEKVRDQHNPYDMYSDRVFWILIGCSAAVSILMTFGTAYDYYLILKVKKRKKTLIFDPEKYVKNDQCDQILSSEGERKCADATPISKINSSNNLNNKNDSNNNNNNMKNHINNNNSICSSSSSSSADDEADDREKNGIAPGKIVQELNVFEELILSFSIRENVKTICDSSVGRDTISTVHGLRAISMAWVILGHTCIVIFKYSDNMEYRKIVEKKFLFQTITNGAFSVDTFFFMGGLLVSYLFFRTNAMGDLNRLTQGTRGFVAGLLKFIGLLLYRFCRLTTPYMFILGVVEVSMKWFHANSVFEPPTADHENCPNYWWRNLLYINTLYPVDQMCMLWSWYVADDTQFYIVGGVILVIATNYFKFAAASVIILLVSSWFTTGYIALINNHMPSLDDPLALFDKIYDKPWTRLGPYLIGMSVGYLLFKTDCKIKMSKATVVIGWLLSFACLLSLLYGLYEAELSPITAAAYSSLSHSAWALGLSWIVVACSTGYGGWVNKILSSPILYPFSRVTYCAYLVHPIVIRLTAMNLDSPFHLGKDTVVITFFGQVVLSYIFSFIISVAFEAPVVSMLKILSPKKKKRLQ